MWRSVWQQPQTDSNLASGRNSLRKFQFNFAFNTWPTSETGFRVMTLSKKQTKKKQTWVPGPAATNVSCLPGPACWKRADCSVRGQWKQLNCVLALSCKWAERFPCSFYNVTKSTSTEAAQKDSCSDDVAARDMVSTNIQLQNMSAPISRLNVSKWHSCSFMGIISFLRATMHHFSHI